MVGVLGKIGHPYSVTFLTTTPIFEWMRLGVAPRIDTKKIYMCLKSSYEHINRKGEEKNQAKFQTYKKNLIISEVQ